MGKNQAYKSMQRSRLGSSSAAPDEVEDGMVDGSFHSPEWHAARLASLNTSHTITWEEYKKKQKEEEMRKGEWEADKDRMMREYRAQLDAERARKLSHGKTTPAANPVAERERDSKKRNSKKRKHSKRSSDFSSSSEASSSDDEERESKRSKSRSKIRKREKKHRSKSKHSIGENETGDDPLPLSRFFGNVKS